MPSLRNKLCIVDVGHGNCAVVTDRNGEVVVIDAGLRNGLLEFLRNHGIVLIRTVYLSHADEDHIGGLINVLAAGTVRIGRVVLNGDASKGTKVWGDLLLALRCAERDGAIERWKVGLTKGERENLSDVVVAVLAPSQYLAAKAVAGEDRQGRRISSNTMSAVIRVDAHGQPVALLAGDIDGVGLDDLLADRETESLRAPILVYPHHGGRPGTREIEPFAEKLLRAISPALVVFSVGRQRKGYPRLETVSALRRFLPDARIVCTQLSKDCSEHLPTASTGHLSQAFALGSADGASCGGTVLVALDTGGAVQPEANAHREFIRACVETPMCLRCLGGARGARGVRPVGRG